MRQFPVKAKRACDHCRSRKSACHIESVPPCRLCALSGRQCTFDDAGRPRKRQRTPSFTHNNSNGTTDDSPGGSEGPSFAGPSIGRQYHDAQANARYTGTGPGIDAGSMTGLPSTSSPIHGNHFVDSRTQHNANNTVTHTAHRQQASNEPQRTAHTSWLDPALLHETFDLYANTFDTNQAPWMDPTLMDMNNDDFNLMPSPADQLEPTQSKDPSHRPDNTYNLLCGLTGDPDPYIVRNYQHGPDNLFVFKRLALRSLSQDNLPVQFLVSPLSIGSSGATQDKSVSEGPSLHAQLAQIVGPDVGTRYIELYV